MSLLSECTALADEWEDGFATNQVHITCIDELRAILARHEPGETLNDLREKVAKEVRICLSSMLVDQIRRLPSEAERYVQKYTDAILALVVEDRRELKEALQLSAVRIGYLLATVSYAMTHAEANDTRDVLATAYAALGKEVGK